MPITAKAYQKCINPDCATELDCASVTDGFKCPQCGSLLDVRYNWDKVQLPAKLNDFAARWAKRDNPLNFSGVWRFRNLLDFCEDQHKVTIGEGQTILQKTTPSPNMPTCSPDACICSMKASIRPAHSKTT